MTPIPDSPSPITPGSSLAEESLAAPALHLIPTRERPILGLQVGPQNVPWPELRRWVLKAEALGFDEVWLADHFLSVFRNTTDPYLEMWSGMAALMSITSTIRIGSLVASVTHRNPGIMAVSAATLDNIGGGGRFVLGLGAGWSELEHRSYGIPLPSPGTRLAMLAEAIQICRLLWRQDGGRVNFQGTYFQLNDAPCQMTPFPGSTIPILVGAQGEKVALRVVAEHADIWNLVGGDEEAISRKSAILDRHCAEIGRDPASLVRSIEIPIAVASTPAQARQRLERVSRFRGYKMEHPEDIVISGTPDQAIAKIRRYIDLGITQFMLITMAPFDDEELELFAREVMPAFR